MVQRDCVLGASTHWSHFRASKNRPFGPPEPHSRGHRPLRPWKAEPLFPVDACAILTAKVTEANKKRSLDFEGILPLIPGYLPLFARCSHRSMRYDTARWDLLCCGR